MNLSFLFVCLWVVLAFVLQMIPSKDNHWRRAYFLIIIGIPLVGWVTKENGPVLGLLAVAIGTSVLRWPMIYMARWVREQITS